MPGRGVQLVLDAAADARVGTERVPAGARLQRERLGRRNAVDLLDLEVDARVSQLGGLVGAQDDLDVGAALRCRLGDEVLRVEAERAELLDARGVDRPLVDLEFNIARRERRRSGRRCRHQRPHAQQGRGGEYDNGSARMPHGVPSLAAHAGRRRRLPGSVVPIVSAVKTTKPDVRGRSAYGCVTAKQGRDAVLESRFLCAACRAYRDSSR